MKKVIKNNYKIIIGFLTDDLTKYATYLDEYNVECKNSYKCRILGDATGEMGPFYDYYDADGYTRHHNNWYKNNSGFIGTLSWFHRGAGANNGYLSGQFDFDQHSGSPLGHITFRIALAVQ